MKQVLHVSEERSEREAAVLHILLVLVTAYSNLCTFIDKSVNKEN